MLCYQKCLIENITLTPEEHYIFANMLAEAYEKMHDEMETQKAKIAYELQREAHLAQDETPGQTSKRQKRELSIAFCLCDYNYAQMYKHCVKTYSIEAELEIEVNITRARDALKDAQKKLLNCRY